jgi:cellulose synthase/poly-beta-1,6-N-acetylglucosamine synthase-like glycosyltransferase
MSMQFFLASLAGVYGITLVLMTRVWKRIVHVARPAAPKKFSIIIPFRDEAGRLPDILSDVAKLEPPAGGMEVIFVNDHSSDGSVDIVQKFVAGQNNLLLVHTPQPGKKHALTTGVEHAGGEIIATTDADCRLRPRWLVQLQALFCNEAVKMVAGPVLLQGTGFFAALQAVEMASLTGSSAVFISWRRPIMCSGANLAFLRSAFFDVGGYEGSFHQPSGDDEVILNKINQRFPDGVRFAFHPAAAVTTQAAASWRQFVQQRVRWASKWKTNTSTFTRTVALVVWLMQVATLGLFYFSIVHLSGVSIAGLMIKIGGEFLFLRTVCRQLLVPWHGLAFLALQVVYPFYVLGVGAWSLVGTYVWKSRPAGGATRFKKQPDTTNRVL